MTFSRRPATIQTMKIQYDKLAQKELEAILITCDGYGKKVKAEALEELELRAFFRGQQNIEESLNRP